MKISGIKFENMSKGRVAWVDILKALGILSIFCGHMGKDTGHLYEFVFLYHVPLFFFASGLFAGKMDGLSFWEVVKKKFNQILLPYCFLVVVNMIVLILLNEADFITYIKYVKQFIWGIRNQLPAAAMWFFSCLFCTAIIFDILRRVLKRKSLLLLVSLFCYLIAIKLFPNRPDVTPSWFFNLDSAIYYLIYYTIGYAAGDLLVGKYSGCEFKLKRLFGVVGVSLLFFYIYTVYMEKDFLGDLIISIPMVGLFYPIIRAVFIIFGNIVVAKVLGECNTVRYIGSQTLWLCGNESIAKHIMNAAAGIIGFTIEIKSALSAIVYASLLIMFIIYLLTPLEKKVFDYCVSYLGMRKVGDKG